MSNFTRQIIFLVAILATAYAGFWVYTNVMQSTAAGSTEPPSELPRFHLPNLDDKLINIRSFLNQKDESGALVSAGKPLIINFWATWCAPCRKEIPLLIEFQENNTDLQVVGVAYDEASTVKNFAEDIGIEFNYPNLVGVAKTSRLNQLVGNASGSLPYTMVTDANGKVVYTRLGIITDEHLAQIRGIFNNEPTENMSENVSENPN